MGLKIKIVNQQYSESTEYAIIITKNPYLKSKEQAQKLANEIEEAYESIKENKN